ncbi:peptide-N(4)-(N-acetyl-beta-glucosaminyl)asparagine amidase [Chironomus tepperi]|uniref:peptide-N(4)-(N-acetyl-beta- glucosaminyl)asparagine amidase n=1 Tax=Chironomus tepperi TaxID=113505 RepID=UPI00391F76C1
MSVNLDVTNKLEKGPKSVYIGSVTICLKLLENIINNPKEEKFRKFKKSNPKIANEMLVLDGIEELFKEIGFELENNELILRRGGLGVINKLKIYRDFLQKRLEFIRNNDSASIKSSSLPDNKISSKGAIQKPSLEKPVVKDPVTPIRITACKPFQQRISFPQCLNTNNSFLKELEQLSDLVMQYEDEELKKSALRIMPVEKFKLNAIENLRKFQKLIKQKEITDDEPPLDDFILEELAAWFKNDFFTWVNNMDCKVCKGETITYGTKLVGNVRVEMYSCNKCQVITEFPRYNDIEKLLVTRSGRCGEFANCFTFLCRCLGYDARYIYSTSDHVWTEVYNHTKKRFIHIDPSENVFDSPLMYEYGWNKKLDYVIAFTCDDVQDVTWRYSNQHDELLKRRKRCSEGELISAIIELRSKRQSSISEGRKKFIKMRTVSELAELMILREPTENERKGRSSGSLAWRLGRGETEVSSNYIFKLLQSEINAKEFNVRYSCAKNRYERFIGTNVIDSASDWKTWEYKSESIFRKVEHDHKMAYLSRNEDKDVGTIEWRFDFDNLSIKSINLKMDSATFQTGKLGISYKDKDDKIVKSKDDLIGLSKFSIHVRMSDGSGDCAWQHAQLFRQKLTSEDFPFELSIQFN